MTSSLTAILASFVAWTRAWIVAAPLAYGGGVPARPADDDVVMAPAISVEAAPRSLTVVSVTVPPGVATDQPVAYDVIRTSIVSLLGRMTGALAPAGGAARAERRDVVLTLRVPARMRAGEVEVARVRFTAAGRAVEVPVRMVVGVRHEIEIAPARALTAVRAGTRLALSYRLTNLGNALDTVRVTATLPPGWRLLDGALPVAPLDAWAIAPGEIHVWVPAAASGDYSVRLGARGLGAQGASASMTVEVLSPESAASRAGPVLRTTTALAAGAGSAGAIASVQLHGNVSDAVTIAARASMSHRGDSRSIYALSSAGVFAAPASLALLAPRWRVGAGMVGEGCSDLCGSVVTGRGLSLAARRARVSTLLLAARPERRYAPMDAGDDARRGELGVARVDVTWTDVSLWSAISHLREPLWSGGGEGRRLDAVTLGGGLSDATGGRWLGEVAGRRYESGEGVGFVAGYARRTTATNLEVRYAHAPGGTRAFARATNDITATASRSFGKRFSLNGSAWQSSDAGGAGLSALSMRGWSVESSARLTPAVAVSLASHGSGFLARTGLGDFGTGERGVLGALDARRGVFEVRGSASGAWLSRTTPLASGAAVEQRAPRAAVAGAIGLRGERGGLSVTGHLERTGFGLGFPERQGSLGVRVEQVLLAEVAGARLYAEGSGARLINAGPRLVSLLGRLRAALANGVALELTAERNPFIYQPLGGGRTTYVLNVTQRASLPRLPRRARRGTIFQDLNGNGRRDDGEPPFARVVVRRGAEEAVTDARGVYTLSDDSRDDSRDAPEIDARSLPVGWIPPATRPVNGESFGIVAVAAVPVRLEMRDADSARVSDADLEEVVVVARDSSGREWLARRESPRVRVFDALPPGRYSVDVDASLSREPLLRDGATALLVVGAPRPAPPIVVRLRARALRFGSDSTRKSGSPRP